MTDVQGTVFLILLITKPSSDPFGVYPLAKMFLYFEILTLSPTLTLGFFLLRFSLYLAWESPVTSIGFVLIVL